MSVTSERRNCTVFLLQLNSLVQEITIHSTNPGPESELELDSGVY